MFLAMQGLPHGSPRVPHRIGTPHAAVLKFGFSRTASTPMTITAHLRFAMLFLGLYAAMQTAYYLLPDPALNALLGGAVVDVAALVVNLLTPAEEVATHGPRLGTERAALVVIRGCDGSGAAFMVTAAVLALGASSWRRLLAGALGAAALIYVLNELRIVGLYYVLATMPDRFALVHEYLAPLVLVAASSLYFVLWAWRGAYRRESPEHEPQDQAPATSFPDAR